MSQFGVAYDIPVGYLYHDYAAIGVWPVPPADQLEGRSRKPVDVITLTALLPYVAPYSTTSADAFNVRGHDTLGWRFGRSQAGAHEHHAVEAIVQGLRNTTRLRGAGVDVLFEASRNRIGINVYGVLDDLTQAEVERLVRAQNLTPSIKT